MGEKQVAIADLFFFCPRDKNSLGASTLFQTEDGKYYALYMALDGALRLREAQVFHPKSIKKVEDYPSKKLSDNPFAVVGRAFSDVWREFWRKI